VVNSWSGGFQAQVVISNTGSGATSNWTASWTFPSGQQLASDWSGVFTQSGANVTVTSETYNGSIAPGSSLTIGFTATGTAPATLAVTC
jgi:cellulase/cellobiase CelA1